MSESTTTSGRPLARWKDLCLDAVDPGRMGTFWSNALGLGLEHSPGRVVVVATNSEHRIWINQVDCPRAAKNRIHLDVDTDALADLETLGATLLASAEETGFGWNVMADPEGGEFCAFLRDRPSRRDRHPLHGIGIDCADHKFLAAWWGMVFGLEPVEDVEHGVFTLEGATGHPFPSLDFACVPEPKTEPNRVHWDVFAESMDSVEKLIHAGARRLWDADRWTVLADPEGNEFCVFPV